MASAGQYMEDLNDRKPEEILGPEPTGDFLTEGLTRLVNDKLEVEAEAQRNYKAETNAGWKEGIAWALQTASFAQLEVRATQSGGDIKERAYVAACRWVLKRANKAAM